MQWYQRLKMDALKFAVFKKILEESTEMNSMV